jgi:hypothetical protein
MTQTVSHKAHVRGCDMTKFQQQLLDAACGINRNDVTEEIIEDENWHKFRALVERAVDVDHIPEYLDELEAFGRKVMDELHKKQRQK